MCNDRLAFVLKLWYKDTHTVLKLWYKDTHMVLKLWYKDTHMVLKLWYKDTYMVMTFVTFTNALSMPKFITSLCNLLH